MNDSAIGGDFSNKGRVAHLSAITDSYFMNWKNGDSALRENWLGQWSPNKDGDNLSPMSSWLDIDYRGDTDANKTLWDNRSYVMYPTESGVKTLWGLAQDGDHNLPDTPELNVAFLGILLPFSPENMRVICKELDNEPPQQHFLTLKRNTYIRYTQVPGHTELRPRLYFLHKSKQMIHITMPEEKKHEMIKIITDIKENQEQHALDNQFLMDFIKKNELTRRLRSGSLSDAST